MQPTDRFVHWRLQRSTLTWDLIWSRWQGIEPRDPSVKNGMLYTELQRRWWASPRIPGPERCTRNLVSDGSTRKFISEQSWLSRVPTHQAEHFLPKKSRPGMAEETEPLPRPGRALGFAQQEQHTLGF
jgi:hypothetical protein